MKNCENCNHARQSARLGQTDVVGCSKLTNRKIKPNDVIGVGNVYEGYMYPARRVGDNRESSSVLGLGHGTLLYGLLCDGTLTCNVWESR